MSSHSNGRATSIPARHYSLGEYVEKLAKYSGLRKNNYRTKLKTIGDLCDFCLKDIRVMRRFIGHRNRGFKFSCNECYAKRYDDQPFQSKAYSNKIILEDWTSRFYKLRDNKYEQQDS